MQQDCGLAIDGKSVKLRKLSNARIKWMLSLFMVFMNPTGFVSALGIPLFHNTRRRCLLLEHFRR